MTSASEFDMTLSRDVLAEKLLDADSGGFLAECTPEEAEAMGAFPEDAVELDDALDGAVESAALT
jgi:hypothetical protein